MIMTFLQLLSFYISFFHPYRGLFPYPSFSSWHLQLLQQPEPLPFSQIYLLPVFFGYQVLPVFHRAFCCQALPVFLRAFCLLFFRVLVFCLQQQFFDGALRVFLHPGLFQQAWRHSLQPFALVFLQQSLLPFHESRQSVFLLSLLKHGLFF